MRTDIKKVIINLNSEPLIKIIKKTKEYKKKILKTYKETDELNTKHRPNIINEVRQQFENLKNEL
ncbi:MAG: hypothetical protein Q9M97_04030 [Candidatus Gracilibacteria bacterium]|nr:hypothetical protein [Candidatus Gracilibacteria bacterium]